MARDMSRPETAPKTPMIMPVMTTRDAMNLHFDFILYLFLVLTFFVPYSLLDVMLFTSPSTLSNGG